MSSSPSAGFPAGAADGPAAVDAPSSPRKLQHVKGSRLRHRREEGGSQDAWFELCEGIHQNFELRTLFSLFHHLLKVPILQLFLDGAENIATGCQGLSERQCRTQSIIDGRGQGELVWLTMRSCIVPSRSGGSSGRAGPPSSGGRSGPITGLPASDGCAG